MRVLVLGGNGMLGHKICQGLAGDFEMWATVRGPSQRWRDLVPLKETQVLGGIDVTDEAALSASLDRVRPDVVVNCVGVVKQVEDARNAVTTISINSVLPHRLANLCRERDVRLIHFSTDCVFSGDLGDYAETDPPDARDLYGRSKLLGEVVGAGCLTIRTSIIGREIATGHGLVEWFLAQTGQSVPGYSRAIFSGFPTTEMASILAMVLTDYSDLEGLYHVSAEPISKLELLELLAQAYRRPVGIVPSADVVVDRSLDSTRFRTIARFTPKSWTEMIDDMVHDGTPYAEWRGQ